MSYVPTEANVGRYLLKHLQDLGTSLVVPVKDGSGRFPFEQATEDEALIFRFVAARRQNSRANVWHGVIAWEVHCMTKRGDLRTDKKSDRHLVLAGHVQNLYRDDLSVYDAATGDRTVYLGEIQGLDTTVHTRDKRNTIFGADVDYSVETPTVLQAVVAVTGLFQTSV